MTPKEFYKWCVDNNCEDLEMIGVNAFTDVHTLYTINKGNLHVMERTIWENKKPKEQKCILLN